MNDRTAERGQRLTALLICPDQILANQFLAAAESLGELAIASHLDDYPAVARLGERVRQAACDVVLIDVGTRRDQALELTSQITDHWPHLSTVGLNRTNDPETILQCLRSGGTEFLSSPFSAVDVAQAVQRMLRRKSVEARPEESSPGRLLAFAPVKGGAGATTLASNTAYQICQVSKAKVLLVDFNLFAGVVSFLLRIDHPYSAVDALKHSGQLDPSLWASLVGSREGLDILLAPEKPEPAIIEPYPVQEVLEYSRSVYDYVVVDLGSICEPVSMATLSVANTIYLVCSSDLPSLFMMRRTIPLVEELGYSREQFRILVNRMERRAELSIEDMEKIFRASVSTTFPDDEAGVLRALRDGAPLADSSDLGRTISKFARGLIGPESGSRANTSGVGALKELLSGT